jgi:hypothetical protein
MQLDTETVLAAKEIEVGIDLFKIIESPGKIIFYDSGHNDGISITGKFDNNLLKKDIQEHFSSFFIVRNEDIRNYTWYEGRPKGYSIDHIEEFSLPYESWNKIIQEEQKDEFNSPQDFFSKEGLEDAINQTQEDVWYKNDDKQDELEPDEKMKHTFGNQTIEFGIRYPISKENPVCILTVSDGKTNGENVKAYLKGYVETAENLIANSVRNFDQKDIPSILNIGSYLESQIMKSSLKVELSDSKDITTQLAKKAGYVQGVCECVAAIGDDHALGKKLLSEMNVTKDMAKKFASPETYKALEQGIFAPQQKLEQTHSTKR